MFGDEFFHDFDAFGVVGDFDLDALGADVFFGALEGFVFADDDAGDAVEKDGAAAHGAGGEGGVDGAFPVDGGGLPACVFEAVHFGVVDGAAVLDAPVVASADDLAAMDEDGADGDAAFGAALAGFFDGCLEEGIVGCVGCIGCHGAEDALFADGDHSFFRGLF